MIQILRKLGPRAGNSTEPDVLELMPTEVAAVAPGVIDITWSSVRHTTINCLFIEPRMHTGAAKEILVELEAFHGYACAVPKHRIALARDGHVLVEWAYRRPRLPEFIATVSAKFPNVRVGSSRRVILNLRNFVSQPETERHAVLLFLKQLGFSSVCVRMLKRRMRMSAVDAARLIDSL